MKRLLLFGLLVLIFQTVNAQRLVPFVANNQQYILNDTFDDFSCYDIEVFQDSMYLAVRTSENPNRKSIAVYKNNVLYDANIIDNDSHFDVYDLVSNGNQLFAVGRIVSSVMMTSYAAVGILSNGSWSYYSYSDPGYNSFQFAKFFNQKLYLFGSSSDNVLEFSNGEFTNTGIFGVSDAEVFGGKLYFFKYYNTGLYSMDTNGSIVDIVLPCNVLNGFSLLNGSLYVSGNCNDFLYRLDNNGNWVIDDLSLDWSKFDKKKLVQVFRTSSGYVGNFSSQYRANPDYFNTIESFALQDQVCLFGKVQNIIQFENKDWSACMRDADGPSGGLSVVEKGLKGQAIQNENLYKFDTPSFGFYDSQSNAYHSDNFETGLFYKNKLLTSSSVVEVFGIKSDMTVTGYGGQTASGLNSSYAGPVANEYGNEFLKKYHRIWQVTQAEIDYHNNHWYEANYSAPYDLLEWPGNGDALNGEPQVLAPFHDVNGNNIYEPQFGDAPEIKGDEASFYIVSDGREITSQYQPIETARNKSNVEIGVMNYLFKNSNNEALAHTLFTDYRLILRDTEPLQNALFGFIEEYVLGNPLDNYVGSDVQRNMVFGYNGDDFDESSSAYPGYGYEVPACGLVGLNVPINAAMYFMTLEGTEQAPITNDNHYNYMSGLDMDGIFAINIFTQELTTFMYSGEVGVSDVWNEANNQNYPYDRRMVASFQVGELLPNEPVCLSFARVVGSDTLTGGSQSVNAVYKMKQYSDAVQQYYDQYLQTTDCNQLVRVEEVNEELLGVHVFPNPAREKITIQTTRSSISKIELFNVVGSLVHSDASMRTANTSLDVSSYSPGLYSVRIYLEDGTIEVRKIIVE
jgi:hypothetical protein